MINGAELNYELAGDGPAVALLHEALCDLRMWDDHFEPLSRKFTVLRYDLRGFGGSSLPPGPYSNARDLLALLDHAGIGQVALVGGSYGARIVLDTAAVAPDRVTALILVAPAVRDHEWSEPVRASWAEEERLLDEGDIDAATELNIRLWVDGLERGPDAVAEATRERVREMQREAFEVQVAAYAEEPHPGPEEDVEVRFDEMQAPTLIVVGDADVPDVLQIADRLDAELPNARKVVMRDVAHVPPLERPDEFRELALAFLREHAVS